MSKHTPGPWYLNEHPYTNQNEYILATPGKSGDSCRDVVGICQVERSINILEGHRTKEETIANAARIVACVNACEGITDPSVVPELLKYLREAVEDCPCSVSYRLSGHRSECRAPYWAEVIARAEAQS